MDACMSTSSATEREYFELQPGYWANWAIASILAAIAMGLVMQYVMGAMGAVGALYTVDSVGAGWFFHVWHSLVFAAIFGGLYVHRRIAPFRTRILSSIALGIGWGVGLWLVAASIVMPLWLSVMGAGAPSPPAVDPWSGIAHVLWGGLLGGIGAALHKQLR